MRSADQERKKGQMLFRWSQHIRSLFSDGALHWALGLVGLVGYWAFRRTYGLSSVKVANVVIRAKISPEKNVMQPKCFSNVDQSETDGGPRKPGSKWRGKSSADEIQQQIERAA